MRLEARFVNGKFASLLLAGGVRNVSGNVEPRLITGRCFGGSTGS